MRLLAFTIFAVVMQVGCRHHSAQQPPMPMPTLVTDQSVSQLQPPAVKPSPVSQGPAPLAYIVEGGGRVRIMEMEDDRLVTQTVAPAGSIVTIDEADGVRIGKDLLVKGPLPAGKTYQIFIENPGQNVFRSELSRPTR